MWLGYVVTAVVGLSAAALGALLTAQAVLRAAREDRRANRVRDAEHVLAEYQAAAALAYSELSELPPVPPPNRLARAIDRIPSKQLKIALWLTVQRGTLRYFGTRPRELTTRLAYAMAQVHVRIHDERIRSAMEKISTI
jgi:hypothetical protein